MITLRRAEERGHANHGWLDTFHTFSFADYYDPRHMGFRALRVINDDTVDAGMGFGTHGHRDMEIVSWVLDGELAHKDSMGSVASLKPGEAQRMTAGTGVRHSEFNGSKVDPVHFLQIWLLPEREGLTPGYEQKFFPPETRAGQLRLLASPDARDGSVKIHTDASILTGVFDAGQQASYALAPGRYAWVHVARGSVKVNGHELKAGDGAAFEKEATVEVSGVAKGEVLLFDLG